MIENKKIDELKLSNDTLNFLYSLINIDDNNYVILKNNETYQILDLLSTGIININIDENKKINFKEINFSNIKGIDLIENKITLFLEEYNFTVSFPNSKDSNDFYDKLFFKYNNFRNIINSHNNKKENDISFDDHDLFIKIKNENFQENQEELNVNSKNLNSNIDKENLYKKRKKEYSDNRKNELNKIKDKIDNKINDDKNEKFKWPSIKNHDNLIDDSLISFDKTFSSHLISKLLSKRNANLPDSTLTSIEKLYSKADEIENKLKIEIDKIKNENSLILSEFKNTKKNIDSFLESNLINSEFENLKFKIEENLENIINDSNSKIEKINEVIERLPSLEKVKLIENELHDSINLIKKELEIKLIDIKILSEKHLEIKNIIEKMNLNDKNHKEEIFVTQRAWFETNKKLSNIIGDLKFFYKKIKELEIKHENVNLQNANLNVESSTGMKLFLFRANEFIVNNEKRYGLRSGQTVGHETYNNIMGMADLYYNDKFKIKLNVFSFDGIIFRNKKYYFSIGDEFSFNNSNKELKISDIDFYDGNKIYRTYNLHINKNYVEYKVYDERGILLNDSLDTKRYDLKQLCFFRD